MYNVEYFWYLKKKLLVTYSNECVCVSVNVYLTVGVTHIYSFKLVILMHYVVELGYKEFMFIGNTGSHIVDF